MAQLKCGAAARRVTPPLQRNIPQCMRLNLSTGVKDDLYTHALAVESDGKAAILISIDTSGLGTRFTRRVREELKARIGIDPDAVMVSAIHIHTGGPQLMEVFWGQKEDREVTELFLRETVAAAVEAYESRVPVRTYYAEGQEGRVGFCRNYRMTDGTIVTNPGYRRAHEIVAPVSEIDRTLASLRFVDGAGRTVAELVNFACHPDTIGGTEYSADYPGELRRRLREARGCDHTVVFLNGFSGNVNHIDGVRRIDPSFRYPKDHYKAMGALLAESLLSMSESELGGSAVAYATRRFYAPRRQPTEENRRWAEEVRDSETASKVDKRLAEELFRLIKHPKYRETVELQAIRIGELTVIGFPGEPFSEIALELRRRLSGRRLMLSELANNELGYFATEPAYSAGVYEAILPSDPFELPVIDRMLDEAEKLAGRI